MKGSASTRGTRRQEPTSSPRRAAATSRRDTVRSAITSNIISGARLSQTVPAYRLAPSSSQSPIQSWRSARTTNAWPMPEKKAEMASRTGGSGGVKAKERWRENNSRRVTRR